MALSNKNAIGYQQTEEDEDDNSNMDGRRCENALRYNQVKNYRNEGKRTKIEIPPKSRSKIKIMLVV